MSLFGCMNKAHQLGSLGIDCARESMLSFSEAARYVGKLKGRRTITPQTLWRWATKGCRQVVLETICVGGARCTSKEALQRFFDALTRAKQGGESAQLFNDGSVLSRSEVEVDDVDGVLRRAGIVGPELREES